MKPLQLNTTDAQQQRLTQYCRTGKYKPLSNITKGRIKHYRQLVNNIIDDTLQSAFPLTYVLLSTKDWMQLVTSFFANHNCKSNSVWKMPAEFYEYVKATDFSVIKMKHPFLCDLLLFEWTEIAVFMMEDIPAEESDNATGDLLQDLLVLNPEHQILSFKYPVHTKRANEIEEADESNYFVLIFRDKETGKVNFIDLSLFYVWLLQEILNNNKPVDYLLQKVSSLLGVSEREAFSNCSIFLQELYNQKFIIGFKQLTD